MPAFIAWRENTASPANSAMEMVIQITPAIGSPAAGGTIAALLSLILTSDICAAPSPTCAPDARSSLLRQTAGLFRGDAPFHPSERTICDEKRKRPFNAARCVAMSLSVVTVHLIVLSQSASR